MSPSLPDILTGVVVALTEPPPPESAGEFAQGRVGVLAMLSLLAAQEADRGPAAAVWENQAIRTLCRDAAGAYDGELGGRLAQAADVTDGDGSLTALTAANAELRRTLDALHVAVEARSDRELDRRILALHREVAGRRMLHLPGSPG
jgi:hypothetical protein